MNGHKLMKIYLTKQSVNLKEYTSNMTRFNKKCAQAISFISVGAIKYRTHTLFAYDNTGCFAIWVSRKTAKHLMTGKHRKTPKICRKTLQYMVIAVYKL